MLFSWISPGLNKTLLHKLVISGSVSLYVHRDHKDYQGHGALDGYLDFHTAPDL